MKATFTDGFETIILVTTKAEFISLLSTVTDVIIDDVEYLPSEVTEDMVTIGAVGYTSGLNIYYRPKYEKLSSYPVTIETHSEAEFFSILSEIGKVENGVAVTPDEYIICSYFKFVYNDIETTVYYYLH